MKPRHHVKVNISYMDTNNIIEKRNNMLITLQMLLKNESIFQNMKWKEPYQ